MYFSLGNATMYGCFNVVSKSVKTCFSIQIAASPRVKLQVFSDWLLNR